MPSHITTCKPSDIGVHKDRPLEEWPPEVTLYGVRWYYENPIDKRYRKTYDPDRTVAVRYSNYSGYQQLYVFLD